MREGVNEVVDIVVDFISKVRQCGVLSEFWELVSRLLDELLGLLVEDVLKVLLQLFGLVVVMVFVVDNDRLVVVKFMVFMRVNDRLGLVVVNDRLRLVDMVIDMVFISNDRLFSKPGPSLVRMFSASTAPSS